MSNNDREALKAYWAAMALCTTDAERDAVQAEYMAAHPPPTPVIAQAAKPLRGRAAAFARQRQPRPLKPLPEDMGAAPLDDPEKRARVNRVERSELASAPAPGGRYAVFASSYDNGTMVYQGKFLSPREDGSEKEHRAFTARDVDSLNAVAVAILDAIDAIAADPSLIPPIPPIAPAHAKFKEHVAKKSTRRPGNIPTPEEEEAEEEAAENE